MRLTFQSRSIPPSSWKGVRQSRCDGSAPCLPFQAVGVVDLGPLVVDAHRGPALDVVRVPAGGAAPANRIHASCMRVASFAGGLSGPSRLRRPAAGEAGRDRRRRGVPRRGSRRDLRPRLGSATRTRTGRWRTRSGPRARRPGPSCPRRTARRPGWRTAARRRTPRAGPSCTSRRAAPDSGASAPPCPRRPGRSRRRTCPPGPGRDSPPPRWSRSAGRCRRRGRWRRARRAACRGRG